MTVSTHVHTVGFQIYPLENKLTQCSHMGPPDISTMTECINDGSGQKKKES